MPDSSRPFHRPLQVEAAFFDDRDAGGDPAALQEAADRAASILVRGARASGDGAVADRVLHLAEEEGIETIAELWSGSAPDSLAGCLWRLYLIRSWVHADPIEVARDFEVGRLRAPVARVVAGVADPPGPEELRTMIDDVLRGVASADFADVLFRASAFVQVLAAGQDARGAADPERVARMVTLGEQLHHAAREELGEPLT